MKKKIADIIEKLNLLPHPEGGYFKENYRSEKSISINGYEGNRNFGTAIYYLLKSENFSAFHRIKQDETWHFYQGSVLDLHIISPEGNYELVKIGNNIKNGEVPQYTVLGGYWFGASVSKPNSYSLCGCTVAPGFNFKDFEMPETSRLIQLFPEHEELIELLSQ